MPSRHYHRGAHWIPKLTMCPFVQLSQGGRGQQAGLTLVELMVAMTISLLLVLAMGNMYVNLARTNDEMTKTNGLIENGRFAIQILENDLVHAGYWSGIVPQFDDLTVSTVPGDVPTGIPNPCAPYNTWDSGYRIGLTGIAVQTSDVLPTGTGCSSLTGLRAGSDVLIIRHAETCVPGVGNCDPVVAGRLYVQSSRCAAEFNAGTAVTATSSSITLSSNASAATGTYTGMMLYTTGGTGAGQYRSVSAYNGSTNVATISTPWSIIPDSTTTYAFAYLIGTSTFPLHQRDCVGTGSPATLPITAGTVAERRRFISDIYYVTDVAHPDRAGQVVPTLMRSQLDQSGGVPTQLAPAALIEDVEAVRYELGIDNVSKTGAAVDFTQPIVWVDPTTKTSPTNRGDGTPDSFVRCTTAAPCSVAQLMNVVAVKIYVLARARDTTTGYTDAKTYCLGDPAADGSCPAANRIPAANDAYKRHVFTTTVRLINISGRRETPS